MRHLKAFTLIELLVVISIIALLIGILLPALGAARRVASQMKNSSQLRGVHQSAVIFASGNRSYLPGVNTSGTVVLTTDAVFAALSGANTKSNGGGDHIGGGHFSTRDYILLNGNFIAGDLLLNPLDTPDIGKWTNPAYLPNVPKAATAGQFSYSLLNIIDTPIALGNSTNSPGRVGEWRDNANSQAILFADRNSAPSTISPRSVWATSAGSITDWTGNTVWGDNHAEFDTSSTFTTQYLAKGNQADRIFNDAVINPLAGDFGDNAYFGYTSSDY